MTNLYLIWGYNICVCGQVNANVICLQTTLFPGYTICWDNVGKQIKARHQTRNHGNQYKNWALAFIVKNRIRTTHFDDEMTIRSSDIPVEKFCVTKDEASTIREHMIIMVQRIVTAYMPLFQPLEDNVIKSTKHAFHAESCEKSELV